MLNVMALLLHVWPENVIAEAIKYLPDGTAMMAALVEAQAKFHAFKNAFFVSERPSALAPKVTTLYVTFADEYWKMRKSKTMIYLMTMIYWIDAVS